VAGRPEWVAYQNGVEVTIRAIVVNQKKLIVVARFGGVNAHYSVSIMIENTFLVSPYKILSNDSNGHGCYFKNYYYSNIWITHVQSPTNLPNSMWKLVFNIVNVILKFKSLKRKTHKVQRNKAPFKTLKKYAFGTKKL
jgi:hypothetical protein